MNVVPTLDTINMVCDHRVGQRVRVSQSSVYAHGWPDVYVIVGIQWEYYLGDRFQFNISIASEDEIERRSGSTDGWSPEDLIPVH